jgi:hypothetical protein
VYRKKWKDSGLFIHVSYAYFISSWEMKDSGLLLYDLSENRLFPFHVRYCGFLKLLWAFILLFGSGAERTTSEDIALSGDGKVGKGGQSKHKKKKRHGCVFQNFNLTLFIVRYCHS